MPALDDWDAQMLFFLSKGYRVVAHDRRCHGRYAADAFAVAEGRCACVGGAQELNLALQSACARRDLTARICQLILLLEPKPGGQQTAPLKAFAML